MELECSCCGGRLPEHYAITSIDRLSGVPGTFFVRICERCGSGTSFPFVDESELGQFYAGNYNPHADWQPPKGLLAMISRWIRAFIASRALRSLPLSKLAGRSGEALDVGCGRGDLGALLITEGWQVTGVEPSPEACVIARRQGVDAIGGTLGSADLGDRKFDVITFQHSLEHVVDPTTDAAIAARLLTPGGFLLISVPNFGSLQRRLFNGRWFHLDLPRHRFHYTADGLRALAEKAGLEVDEIGTSSSPVGLPGSLAYAVFGHWIFRGPLLVRAVTLGSLVTYPLALLMNAFGGGDVLHMVAKKTPEPESRHA